MAKACQAIKVVNNILGRIDHLNTECSGNRGTLLLEWACACEIIRTKISL